MKLDSDLDPHNNVCGSETLSTGSKSMNTIQGEGGRGHGGYNSKMTTRLLPSVTIQNQKCQVERQPALQLFLVCCCCCCGKSPPVFRPWAGPLLEIPPRGGSS